MLYLSNDAGGTWTQIGDWNNYYLPNTLSLSFSPEFATDKTLFMGGEEENCNGFSCTNIDGGVYKSVDGGLHWTPASTGLPPNNWGMLSAVNDVAMSPDFANDHMLFAATSSKDGVFKSADGAKSWTKSNNGLPIYSVEGIRFSPDFVNDGEIFALTTGGLYHSTDQGSNWEQIVIDPSADYQVLDLAFSPNYAVDKTMVAGSWEGAYFSTDNGQSWTLKNRGLTKYESLTVAQKVVFSPSYLTDHTLFTLGLDQNGNNWVYRSMDAGESWISIEDNLGYSNPLDLTISPDGQFIFVAGEQGIAVRDVHAIPYSLYLPLIMR